MVEAGEGVLTIEHWGSVGTGGWNLWVTCDGYSVGVGWQIQHQTCTHITHMAKPTVLPMPVIHPIDDVE